jgi:hypothetical protein
MAPDRVEEAERQLRRYDKGERRYKHVGKGAEPEIEFVAGSPRMWIGKCPTTLTSDDHVRLVNEAIPADNGDREVAFPKKIYAVHKGAIYEGQTTDRGASYHGYPYRGKLGRGMLEALRRISVAKSCQEKFANWVKEHIEVHGK